MPGLMMNDSRFARLAAWRNRVASRFRFDSSRTLVTYATRHGGWRRGGHGGWRGVAAAVFAAAIVVASAPLGRSAETDSDSRFDVVVYGGTSAAVTAAVQAKRMGKSVAMGSYTIDSHNVQRYITPEGHVQNEGDIGVPTRGPYQIGYQALVPKRDQCANLLVPVCVSGSHIAFGSIRMEPVFMILGQSAGTAAVLAIDREIAVQDVPYGALRERLLSDGQVLETPPGVSAQGSHGRNAGDFAGIVVDDVDAELAGTWTMSTANRNWIEDSYLRDGDTNKAVM